MEIGDNSDWVLNITYINKGKFRGFTKTCNEDTAILNLAYYRDKYRLAHGKGIKEQVCDTYCCLIKRDDACFIGIVKPSRKNI